MSTPRRRAATAFTAAAALAIGVIPAAFTTSAILAGGEEPTTISPAGVEVGSVVLTTTSEKGTITWNGQTQEFTGGQQCEVSSTGARLLQIRGSVGGDQRGVAGFRDGDIGVFEADAPSSSPNNASQCFRVDSGSFTETESLTFTLHPEGPFSDAPFGDRLLAGSAAVDARVANTRDGTITVSLLDATGEAVKQTDVQWARQKSGSKITIPSTALTIEDGTFNAVRLTATSGSFSVRGATLNLVSQADDRFCLNDTLTDSDGAGASVTYVGPTTGTCFGVTLSSTDTEVRFLKPSTVAPDAQFKFVITWTLPNSGGSPSVLIPDADIDFEVGALNVTELPFCSDYYGLVDADGKQILKRNDAGDLTIANYAAYASNTGFADYEPATPEKEFACIDTRTSSVTAEELQVFDTTFVIGDLKMTIR